MDPSQTTLWNHHSIPSRGLLRGVKAHLPELPITAQLLGEVWPTRHTGCRTSVFGHCEVCCQGTGVGWLLGFESTSLMLTHCNIHVAAGLLN